MFVSGIVTVNEDLVIISGALLNFIMFAYWIKDLKKTHNRNRERKRKVENYIFNGSARIKSTSSSKFDKTIKRVKLKKNNSHTYITPGRSSYSIMNPKGTFEISFYWSIKENFHNKKYVTHLINSIEVNGYTVYREIADEKSLLDAVQDIMLRMGQVNADEPSVIKSFMKLCSHMIAQNTYHRNNRDVTSHNIEMWITDEQRRIQAREVLYPDYESKLEVFVEQIYSDAEKIFEKVNNGLYRSDKATMNHTPFYLLILEMTDISNPSIEEIKKQYRKLAKKYHPDIENGDEKHFRLITKAYEGILKEYSK